MLDSDYLDWYRANAMAYNHARFLTTCISCGRKTNRAYARANGGKCKSCVTGQPVNNCHICPDCGERRLTSYQRAHHYHCDECTKQADPMGYYRELTTPYEPDY